MLDPILAKVVEEICLVLDIETLRVSPPDVSSMKCPMSPHFHSDFSSFFFRFKLPRQSHRQANTFLDHQTKSYLLFTTKHLRSNILVPQRSP